jgi:hypothetical protein
VVLPEIISLHTRQELLQIDGLGWNEARLGSEPGSRLEVSGIRNGFLDRARAECRREMEV